MPHMGWWWCLHHKRVEEGGGCGSTLRIGPYDTQQEAAEASERTRQRAAGQEARDRADDNWGAKKK